jgi:DNA repair protein RadC
MASMRDLRKELLYVLCLDTKNNVIKQRRIFEGSLNTSIVHPREVFRFAIEEAAASIILVHNHPSGDPAPSPEDIRATKQLIEVGDLLQIPVLDHVIIGDGCYISMKEEGII